MSVQILINLCENLLNDIKDYASDQQLEMVWKLGLDQHKAFEDILSNIKSILDNTVRAANPKDLTKIQQRASDLKKQIMDSEIFSKYLVHQEMTRLRFRDADKDNELHFCKTAGIISQANTEEEKTIIRNKFEKTSHLLVSKPEVNQNLEDLKQKHNTEIENLKKSHSLLVDEITNKHKEEIKEIKKKHEDERVINNKEKEDLLNQRIEVEQEFQKINDQLIELKEGPPRLTYEVKLNIILTIYTVFYVVQSPCKLEKIMVVGNFIEKNLY